MIAAGIDCGSQAVKAVVLRDGIVAGRAIARAGYAAAEVSREVLAVALRDAGAPRAGALGVTGAGRALVPTLGRAIDETEAAARGAVALFPAARTVIEVGAEQGRALRCDAAGRVLDAVGDDACAAGVGAFAEALARMLDVRVADLGPLALRGAGTVALDAQCVVFVEREVVALIHANVPPADIARAVHEAMARRVASMVHRLGCHRPAALVGGLARNAAFAEALRRALELDALRVPDAPEYCAAWGAALGAADAARRAADA